MAFTFLNREEVSSRVWLFCRSRIGRVINPAVAQWFTTVILDGLGWIGEAHSLELYSMFLSFWQPRGSDLDVYAAGLPMPGRKSATKAHGALYAEVDTKYLLTATGPLIIPAGFQFAAEDGQTVIFQTAKEYQLSASTLIDIEAVSAGESGNVDAGVIDRIMTPLAGLAGVVNPEKLSGGNDAEDDTRLLGRIGEFHDSLLKGTSSALEWAARSVPGVVYARCKPHTPGPGEATLFACDGNGGASAALLADVEEMIERGGPSHAPGYRDAAQTLHYSPPVRWLTLVAASIRMRHGYRLAAYSDLIESAVKARIRQYGLGPLVTLTQMGDAVKTSFTTEVESVSSISARAVQMPAILPITLVGMSGAAWQTSEFTWNRTLTEVSWSGGPAVNVAGLGATNIVQTLHDGTGTRSLTVSILPWAPGQSRWPDSTTEQIQCRQLGEVTQFDESDILVPGAAALTASGVSAVLGNV